ncbi:MAG: enolase C-terminal domain-like protein [Capsulimonadaceae bacterium]|nr:enolase C-terminal domain-like protein [Capsulimonadaceae bacterium]
MNSAMDVRVCGTRLYFLPVQTRMPYRFGSETLSHVTCARCQVKVVDAQGRSAIGWGETPLSVGWVWPSRLSHQERIERLLSFTRLLASAWCGETGPGHPIEIGSDFQEGPLRRHWEQANAGHTERMPWLAALVCCSAFDIAVHDAYGSLHELPVYATYNGRFMNRDLSAFLEPAKGHEGGFAGRYPCDYLAANPPRRIRVWHSVGVGDPLTEDDLAGDEPHDCYPVLLADWIARDGLKCLKIKLRGTDYETDYRRIVRCGEIGVKGGVEWLTTDFNCTVEEPGYVNSMLDQLRDEHPRLYGMLLYVEQPFAYELEEHRIDVHSVAARKPLFMDESAHDWRLIRLGRNLGWTGVALKTCKTQTGAILSACWAKEHGMGLMVQDLTNPMLAQIPHLHLAANVGTIMGLESNAMQFYPDASSYEAAIHPDAYRRRNGCLDLATLGGAGFGYRVDEIARPLPGPVLIAGDMAEE